MKDVDVKGSCGSSCGGNNETLGPSPSLLADFDAVENSRSLECEARGPKETKAGKAYVRQSDRIAVQ
jgi:hypothetical protein